jgi:putative DNA primase/helicase
MSTLQNAIANHGLGINEIILDGNIHRFTPAGDRSKCGWYVGNDNGDYQSGAYGCWKRDIKETFCSINFNELSSKQKQDYAKQQEKLKSKIKSETVSRNLCAKKAIQKRWAEASKEHLLTHPYLINKQVEALNVRIGLNNNLLIPIYDRLGELWNIQSITSSGIKLFSKGAKVKHCFHPIGLSDKHPVQIFLCEGYATGMSIYQATQTPTIVCFNAGNLLKVGLEIAKKYPDAKLVFAADNDQYGSNNTGKNNATVAAQATGGTVALPQFACTKTKPTDFNDLYVLEGSKAVNDQIVGSCYGL